MTSTDYIGKVSEEDNKARDEWNKDNVTEHGNTKELKFDQEVALDPRLIDNGVVYGD